MINLIILCSFLTVNVVCRTCDCAQYTPGLAEDQAEGESAEWINGLIKAFYDMNAEKLLQKISSIIDDEVNPKLPDPVKSIHLTYLNLTDTPAIDLVSHHVTTVTCDDARFKRYTLDFDISFNNPGLMAKVRAEFALSLAATVSLEDLRFSAVLRVEVLMSSDIILPSLQYVKVMFMEQPKLDFDLELYDLIGLDTFGIKDFIRSKIDDVLQKQLVYPGMIFVDMSNGKPQLSVVKNDARLHPAVMSTNITVTPVNTTTFIDSLEGWLEYGDNKVTKVKFPAGTTPVNYQFDVFVEDFQHANARVTVRDVGAFVDDIWFDLRVNVARDIRFGSTKRTYSMRHRDEEDTWDVTIDVYSFILPSIQMFPDTLSLIPSLYSLTNTTHCADHGVLYISLHGGFNLIAPDGGHDPYVKIFLDDKQIGKTSTSDSANPTYDFVLESLLRTKGGPLSEHVIELRAYDYDVWSPDDLIGSAQVGVQNRVGEQVKLTRGEEETESGLTVTVLFRPVPFF